MGRHAVAIDERFVRVGSEEDAQAAGDAQVVAVAEIAVGEQRHWHVAGVEQILRARSGKARLVQVAIAAGNPEIVGDVVGEIGLAEEVIVVRRDDGQATGGGGDVDVLS
jgi:hypothetical protein